MYETTRRIHCLANIILDIDSHLNIHLISASSLTHVIVDDAERIGVQVSKELSPNDLGVLAHQIQIPQIVLLREELMPVGETGRLVPLVRSRGNVAHNVDLERYGRSRK